MTIEELISLGYDLDQLKLEIMEIDEYDERWIREIDRVGETIEMILTIKMKEEE